MCAQESVYRLTNMHLKECSRKVVFVSTGDNVVKMSLPLNVLRQKATSHDLTTEDMWMTSIIDRYKNRKKEEKIQNHFIKALCSCFCHII